MAPKEVKVFWASDTTTYKVWATSEQEAWELIEKYNEGDFSGQVKVKDQERQIDEYED